MTEAVALKPGTPSWVDLSTSDLAKAGEFYAGVLGWTVKDLGPDAGGYVMFHKDGKEVAGGGPLPDPNMPPVWSTYLKVEDAAATAKAAEEAGGKVVMAPMQVMEQGTMAVLQDPTGAYVSIWQPGVHQGAELYNAPGALCWNELATRDLAAAEKFYRTVFGLEPKTEGEADQAYTQFFVGDHSVAGMLDMTGRMPETVPPNWLAYFGVEDIQHVMDQTKKLGGEVRMGPIPSPFGQFAVIADPAGAVFAAIELKP
ncbi:MAG TPA: VOC family protein [Candidatus Dormibacteraeota bacterium]|jgi:hypothetical protein|nr:VOC family protein [Candidatus Dormibacteraeota bacterium]